jgi:hypothetical protein
MAVDSRSVLGMFSVFSHFGIFTTFPREDKIDTSMRFGECMVVRFFLNARKMIFDNRVRFQQKTHAIKQRTGI